jgi:3-isopropylmalate/(R)-2-methylmalate dehydratase large subunit
MAPKGADWDGGRLVEDASPPIRARLSTRVVVIDAADIAPTVTWGTSPEDVVPITGTVPAPESFADPAKQEAARKRALIIWASTRARG